MQPQLPDTSLLKADFLEKRNQNQTSERNKYVHVYILGYIAWNYVTNIQGLYLGAGMQI